MIILLTALLLQQIWPLSSSDPRAEDPLERPQLTYSDTHRTPVTGLMEAAALSPDGRFAARISAGGQFIYLFDNAGQYLDVAEGFEGALGVRWLTDGHLIFAVREEPDDVHERNSGFDRRIFLASLSDTGFGEVDRLSSFERILNRHPHESGEILVSRYVLNTDGYRSANFGAAQELRARDSVTGDYRQVDLGGAGTVQYLFDPEGSRLLRLETGRRSVELHERAFSRNRWRRIYRERMIDDRAAPLLDRDGVILFAGLSRDGRTAYFAPPGHGDRRPYSFDLGTFEVAAVPAHPTAHFDGYVLDRRDGSVVGFSADGVVTYFDDQLAEAQNAVHSRFGAEARLVDYTRDLSRLLVAVAGDFQVFTPATGASHTLRDTVPEANTETAAEAGQ